MESKGAIVGAVLASALLHLAVGAAGWPRLERVTALPPAPAAPVEVELAPLALPFPAAPRHHAPSPNQSRPRPAHRVQVPETSPPGEQAASSRPSIKSPARTPPAAQPVRMANGAPAALPKPLYEPGPGGSSEPQRTEAPSLRASLRPGAPAEAPLRSEPETAAREPAREEELPAVRGAGGSGSLRLSPRGGEERPGLSPGLGIANPLGSPGTGSSSTAKPAGSGDGPGEGDTRPPGGTGKGAEAPGGGAPRGGTGEGGAERPRPPIQNPPERPSAPVIPQPTPAPAPLQPEPPSVKPAPVEPLVQARARYRRNPAPDYPEEARRLRQEGVVLLRVQVNARGRVDEAEVERSSGSPSLDQAATRAVRRWEFEPARRGDTPVASTVTVPVRFRLERE